ncbi:SDR family oxidoreductase [Acuticoccus mangrovi]|uniref:SDR family oxidoreductase n=1 Tax=Acuticoccus mangrovi TaxID=2796142 RepID=A0A934MI49_9HYPH|nr:SDR family oxidoreductase [Acuticoccus mangrovi]MBJ3776801.1 SDR family oxidoreductase [Acuticoccus mangrovi]
MGLSSGRRVLVTGAAGGIGAALMAAFAREGAIGVGLDLTTPEVPDGWIGLAADVTDSAGVTRTIGEAARRLGGLDVLIPNAAFAPPWADIGTICDADWEVAFAVNVRGAMATIRAGAPLLPDGGVVVVMASLNAWRAEAGQGVYTATKHAVLGLTRAAARDLGPRGIRVNAIAPGPIATPALLARMRRRLGSEVEVEAALRTFAGRTALGRLATAEDVANTAVFLAADLANGITGQMLAVDGGI